MRFAKPLLLSLATAAALTACKKPESANSAQPPESSTGVADGVAITPQVPAPAAAPLEAAVIASQPGMEGSTWDLTRMQVTGNILTLQFLVKPAPGKMLMKYGVFKVDDVALIDDQSSQRYSVLKDDSGRPMASPISDDGMSISLRQGTDKTGVVWFKFPAPPAAATSVSVTIPEVGPFDGIAVKR